MTKKKILKKLNELIAKDFEIELDEVDSSKKLIDDLYADSLDLVELSYDIEDEFGIDDFEIAEKFDHNVTVDDLVNAIEGLLNKKR